ncbi:Glycine betaine transporter OpuD [Marinomonas gallaica]|uniref:Glycine betaine transporter OpuD n=1 Tax=Marinomonas gallaica TaxID=1806667 RepID=A0A1C3JQY4_9GAMM|nr:BCCT family transporter [Marinomonas gallaica]SBT17526.1 Glycine betaine transporter OpuD [Marinomonas gallaica]SBT19718.1 Glycine betaine transporter OpuD [Marinomonas gallaica]
MDQKTKKRPKSSDYTSDYKAGQDNVQILGMDVNNPVFTTSAVAIIAFIAFALIFPGQAKDWMVGARGWSIETFDWLFMIGGNIFVLFCLALIVLPVGKIRLGGNEARPEFSTMSWFSMLFAAGMGIGLMFWSVAEPVAYYTDWWGTPLNVEANTPEAASAAMGAVMFHWGLHPWAIYGVVALALAFFSFNKGLPLTIRSAFYPLLGERCWGPIGHCIDIIAVIATIFGLATSLGLGASQAAGGLSFLFGIENNISTQIGIIIVVTSIAVVSVMRGLDGGVKVLSNINMILAGILVLFVAIFGSITGFFGHIFSTTVSYAEYIFPLSNWIGRDDNKFYEGWTVFYWAWWISWSPFVGMFIARVSKGRTVREFMIAVLLVPTVVSIIWMSAFGGQALDQVQGGVGQLAGGLGDVSSAMFQMLENLPLQTLTSIVAIILVLVFFITSSDSGSLVIDSIAAGGKVETPVPQRIFWATMVGLIAGVLLFGGGSEALSSLQAGAVTTGLPFIVILLLMCVSVYKGLRSELN